MSILPALLIAVADEADRRSQTVGKPTPCDDWEAIAAEVRQIVTAVELLEDTREPQWEPEAWEPTDGPQEGAKP